MGVPWYAQPGTEYPEACVDVLPFFLSFVGHVKGQVCVEGHFGDFCDLATAMDGDEVRVGVDNEVNVKEAPGYNGRWSYGWHVPRSGVFLRG